MNIKFFIISMALASCALASTENASNYSWKEVPSPRFFPIPQSPESDEINAISPERCESRLSTSRETTIDKPLSIEKDESPIIIFRPMPTEAECVNTQFLNTEEELEFLNAMSIEKEEQIEQKPVFPSNSYATPINQIEPKIESSRAPTPRCETPLRDITDKVKEQDAQDQRKWQLDLAESRSILRRLAILTLTFRAPLCPDHRGDAPLTSHTVHEKKYRTGNLDEFEKREIQLTQKLADLLIKEDILANQVCNDENMPSTEFNKKIAQLKKYQQQIEDTTVSLTTLRDKKAKMTDERIQEIMQDIENRIEYAKGTLPPMVNAILYKKFQINP
ncbi:MAG: hypothetical protein HEEMFOPI_01243 [Holosporales bacterium]